MRTTRALTLAEPRLALKVSDGKLVLGKDGGRLAEWSPRKFGYGLVTLDPNGGFVTNLALRWLAEEGVTVSLLDFNGWPILTALPDTSSNVLPRLEQMRAYLDPARRVRIARAILEAKHGGQPVPPIYRTIPDLLAYEARVAADYWASKGIERSYPHARDRANALLNYGFGLLETRVRIVLHRLGWDPAIGWLHEPQDGKSAAVYDVMEPWRDLVTRTVLHANPKLGRDAFYPMFRKGWRLRPATARRASEVVMSSISDSTEESISAFARSLLNR